MKNFFVVENQSYFFMAIQGLFLPILFRGRLDFISKNFLLDCILAVSALRSLATRRFQLRRVPSLQISGQSGVTARVESHLSHFDKVCAEHFDKLSINFVEILSTGFIEGLFLLLIALGK